MYFKGDTSLLADAFDDFRKMCLKIYLLDQNFFQLQD